MGPNKVPVGGDGYHPADHDLWKSAAVQAYMEPRGPRQSLEERKRRKRLRNKRYHDTIAQKRASIQERVDRGEITEEEAKCLCQEQGLNIGWWKTQAEGRELSEDYKYLVGQLTHLFGSPENPTASRLSVPWPASASEDAYIQFVLKLIPLNYIVKIDKPHAPKIQQMVKSLLHPDGPFLSEWLTKEEKSIIGGVVNASCTIVNEIRGKRGELAYMKKWEEAKNKFIFSLAPLSSHIPPFAFLHTLDFAFTSHNSLNQNPTPLTDSNAILDIEALGQAQ